MPAPFTIVHKVSSGSRFLNRILIHKKDDPNECFGRLSQDHEQCGEEG